MSFPPKGLGFGDTSSSGKTMRFHYGYFILVPNGHVVPFGDDWGPTTTAYRVGGSLGVRNEKEGTVVGIEVGPVAKSIGFDVVVLVAEHDPGATIVWAPSPDLLREAIRALTTKPELPPTIQTIWEQKNVRMVAIWNQLFGRPLRETFHEFLVEVPLKLTFGEEWYKIESQKPEEQRHVVEKWLRAYRDQRRTTAATQNKLDNAEHF